MCILKRPSFTAAGVSTNLLACDPYGALTNELTSAFGLPSAALARPLDALGHPAGYALAAADRLPAAVAYGYNDVGRFVALSSSNTLDRQALNVNHTRQDGRLAGRALQRGNGPVATTAWSYDLRGLITALSNTVSTTAACLSACQYANDALGRRVSRADSGLAFTNPAFDAYSYNVRSEVIGAQRYHGTDVSDTSTVYGGRQFGYAYDPIGNRTSASETIGGETPAKAYTANELNQYTAIANPGAVGLRGDATNTAVVTVNGQAVHSDDITSDTIPWHFALEADNGSGPDFPFAEIVAVINPPGTNTPDIVSTSSGHLYAPPQNETLTYDDDGNLTADGRWQYTWNGENRLIKAETRDDLPAGVPRVMVEYAYDHQGRMVWKRISTNAVVVSTRTLLWDGYNIIAEQVGRAVPGEPLTVATNHYVWGLDLSGSLQGAGGIGGLLAEIKDGTPYFAAFDANGNVTEYLSANGTLAAHYEYSPFGETVVQSGDLADSFSHRFSTKPWCAVTGLREYELRKYSPRMGRWLSRDPRKELGFKIGQDFRSRIAFPLVRDRMAARIDNIASGARPGSVEAAIARSLHQLAARLRAVSYKQFAASSVNLYTIVRNDPINLIDLLGLQDGDPDDQPWPPNDPGEGKEGDWGDLAKALWKCFEQNHKQEIDEIKKAAEEWAKENKTAACCIVGTGAACYLLGQHTFTDKVEIPAIHITITDDITLSVEGCKECTGDGEWKVEIKFKWDF